MRRKYKFGDKVKVLKHVDGTTWDDKVEVGMVGFVLNYEPKSLFPVHVQFLGFSEVFKFEELGYLNSNIKYELLWNTISLLKY